MENVKYLARSWRTQELKKIAQEKCEIMLQAFTPEGFTVDVYPHDNPAQKWCCGMDGFHRKLSGYLHCKDKEGSDAHIIVHADTREGVHAMLLAHILDGHGFFPLT